MFKVTRQKRTDFKNVHVLLLVLPNSYISLIRQAFWSKQCCEMCCGVQRLHSLSPDSCSVRQSLEKYHHSLRDALHLQVPIRKHSPEFRGFRTHYKSKSKLPGIRTTSITEHLWVRSVASISNVCPPGMVPLLTWIF